LEEKDFIKEKIVGQKGSWKKRGKKVILLFLSGMVFSLGAFLTAAFLFPLLPKTEKKKEKETVAFSESESTELESSTEETEAIEDVVQSEIQKFDFPISAYDSMMGNLKNIIQEGEKSLVDVEISSGGADLLTKEKKQGNGIILEKTGDSLFVLFPWNSEEGEEYRIRFFREKEVEGTKVSESKKDGILILSVPLSAFNEKEMEKLSLIPRGNSRLLQRGETLIGIGAPSGKLYSTVFSYVSYLSYEEPAIDGILEEIELQLAEKGEGNIFFLNTAGQLVGFARGSEESYPRITGLSDCLEYLARLSNGNALPYLGIRVQNTTKKMAELGIPEGIYISEVEEGSPAYNAGIQPGDVLKKGNGEELSSVKTFQEALLKQNPGEIYRIAVLRYNGKEYVELEFSCPLGTR